MIDPPPVIGQLDNNHLTPPTSPLPVDFINVSSLDPPPSAGKIIWIISSVHINLHAKTSSSFQTLRKVHPNRDKEELVSVK